MSTKIWFAVGYTITEILHVHKLVSILGMPSKRLILCFFFVFFSFFECYRDDNLVAYYWCHVQPLHDSKIIRSFHNLFWLSLACERGTKVIMTWGCYVLQVIHFFVRYWVSIELDCNELWQRTELELNHLCNWLVPSTGLNHLNVLDWVNTCVVIVLMACSA